MKITLGSLFDGIAGFPLAATRNKITPVWASEIDPFCIKVTQQRFPSMKHYGDITKINGAAVDPVEIISGGSPCQDLSVAGKRAGLAGERSGLFMEQIRIVREMRYADKANGRTGKHIRPRFMVWENVPGAFSSNKGKDFQAVLEETAKVADETITIPEPPKGKWNTKGCIMGDGWSIAWRVLDAQFWGVPQRRRRIFLVTDFGGQSAPEVLFKREGLHRHIAEGGEAREGIAFNAERSINSTVWDARGYGKGDVSCPITTGQDRIRDYTIITVTAFCPEQSAKTRDIGYEEEKSPTLRGNNTPAISMVMREGCEGGGKGPLLQKEKSAALKCQNHQTVFTPHTYQKVTGPLMTNSHPGSYTGQDAYTDMLVAHCLTAKSSLSFREDQDTLINEGYAVRRLTPLECERLQDYPDGWTYIEWVEQTKKGKLRKMKAKDSPRYKGNGNSVAVCCPEYVFEGIVAIIQKEKILS